MSATARPGWLVSCIVALVIAGATVAARSPAAEPVSSPSSPSAATAPAATPPPASVPGELIVRFRRGSDADDRRTTRDSADVDLERPLLVSGAQLVSVEQGQTATQAERELERDPDVLYAEPNRVVQASALPDDPLFGTLWGLHNTGQTIGDIAGRPGADINAASAWDHTTGSPSVLVAVTDTGVDRGHPDLARNAWTNPGEAGDEATNGRDDDGNGYVDDWRGWDFNADDNDPSDVHGHGTHVAGTIGAAGGNGIGVVGVSPSVSLVGVKVLGDGGSGSTADVADGFAYAGRIGARVVNASLGGDGLSQVSHDAIAAHPGTLYVVAAGNDGANVDSHPQTPCAETPANLICVAATTNRDELAEFSNFGTRSVDVAAPGLHVTSTIPGTTYDSKSGTSMASPHVAGAAALVAAAHPSDDALAIRGRLLTTARRLDDLVGRVGSAGLVDAGAAVGAPANGPPTAALTISPARARTQQRVILDASGSGDADGQVVNYEWDVDGNGSYERATGRSPQAAVTWEAPGTYDVRVRVIDNRGGSASAERPITVTPAGASDPVASFVVAPDPPIAGETAALDASASSAPGGVQRYQWDLDGNGTFEKDGTPNPRLDHRFQSLGQATIGLRVTAPGGDASETLRTVTVRPPQPTARFTIDPPSPVVGQTVVFDGRETTTPNEFIVFWNWDFDGNGTDDSHFDARATHKFTTPGTYTAELDVVDDKYGRSRTTRTFTVRPAVPVSGESTTQATEQPGESDGDGTVEPGEGLLVSPVLRNPGAESLTGVRGTLRSPISDDVRGGPLTANWPNLAPGTGAVAGSPLSAATYGSLVCGKTLDLELEVETDQGQAAVPITVPGGGVSGAPRTPEPFGPFSLRPGWWLSGSIRVPVKGAIRDVNVKIADVRTTDVGNLKIGIGPPSESSTIGAPPAWLIARRGGSGDDIVGAVFDDDAPTPISEGTPPFTGRFRPENPLRGFNGMDAEGDWELYVENWSTTATAELNDIGLEVTPATCNREGVSQPHAEVTASPYLAARGEEITIDASGSNMPGGRIVEYRWDLDDDDSFERVTTSPKTTTRYNWTGYPRGQVQVVSDRRTVATADYVVEVRESRPPTAVLDRVRVQPGQPATLDGSRSFDVDGEIVAYAWDFGGDGEYDASGPVVSHLFDGTHADPKWHSVHLRVIDDTGEAGYAYEYVEVGSPPEFEPGPPPPPPPVPEPYIPSGPLGPPTWYPPTTSGGPLVPGGGRAPRPPQGESLVGALTLKAKVPRAVSLSSFRKGVRIELLCTARCSTSGRLTIPRAAARKLGLGKRDVVVATFTRNIRAGRPGAVRLKAGSKIRRALRKSRRTKLQLRVDAKAPAGGATSSTRATIEIRR